MKTFAVLIETVGDAVPSEIFPSLNAGYDNVNKGIFLLDAESMEDIYKQYETDERIRNITVHGEVENIQEYRNEFPPVLGSGQKSVTSKELEYISGIKAGIKAEVNELIKSPEKTKLLAHASMRTLEGRDFLGNMLFKYQHDQDLSDESFADWLGVKTRDNLYDEMQRFYLLYLVKYPPTPTGAAYHDWCKNVHDYLRVNLRELDEVVSYCFKNYP